jgi:hypothetical protein
MDAVKDDAYEDMAATFQVMMIHWLNDALQQAGVEDREKRRAIINDFCFMFGIWKDQYWFRDSSGNAVFPCIAFAQKGPVTDVGLESLGKIFMPSTGFSFKEYVVGNLAYYFDEVGEDVSQIESGPL